jgi:acyl-coenzyme A thioesterase PaaI-like protein
MINSSETQLRAVQAQTHPFCLVCSGSNPYGLGLRFHADDRGGVEARFDANAALEGYPGLLHGGMIASLLDGAMTNCLFARSIVALTGELTVRYRESVLIGPEVEIRAWLENEHPPLYHLRAELKQDGTVKADASAKFMERKENSGV